LPDAAEAGVLHSYCQNGDGGFCADHESASDIKDTSLAVIAFACAGKSLSDLQNGSDPAKYLMAHQRDLDNLSNVEAHTARYVVAVTSAGQNPGDINGKDYVKVLKSYLKPDGQAGAENYGSFHNLDGIPAKTVKRNALLEMFKYYVPYALNCKLHLRSHLRDQE